MPEAETHSQKNTSKAAVFLRRLCTTVVLLGVVFFGLLSGGLLSVALVGGLVMVLNIIGLLEFYGMVKENQLPCYKWLGISGGIVLIGIPFLYLSKLADRWWGGGIPTMANIVEMEVIIFVGFMMILLIRRVVTHPAPTIFSIVGGTMLGVLYVSWLLGFILKIFFYPAPDGVPFDGGICLLFFILVTKCSDMGAYSLGSLIGRHKMIPKVSPGKTWEGFFGAIILSTVVALVFAHYFGESKLGGMKIIHAAVLGPLLAVGAVLGDLVESVYKRDSGAKDSGAFFPGIGGILDLIDSLLLTAPIMFLYLRFVLFND